MPERRCIADRYFLERELGRGGGGQVHLAWDAFQGKRRLAIKHVAIPKQGRSVLLGDLRNEFSTLSRLRHSHLAQVLEFGVTEREMYFTAEYVEGHDIVEATQYADFNSIFRLIVQVLRAVDFLHRRGILHLDLKPGNILVTDPETTGEWTAKIIDFGIARWKTHGHPFQPGFCGTPPFAAPEIILERVPTPASDIYSLGMIFHLIFAKRFPFPSQKPYEILKSQIYREAELLTDVHPALPNRFFELLHDMLAIDPERRPASPGEILERINDCLGEDFRLRSPEAPTNLLSESDILLHPRIVPQIAAELRSGRKRLLGLIGPEGSGKSRIVRQIQIDLQLAGVRPYFVQSSQALREILPFAEQDKVPVIYKADAAPALWALSDWRESLAPIPLLVAMPAADNAVRMLLDEILELAPLSAHQIQHFLEAEIQGVPRDAAEDILAVTGPLQAEALQFFLQALREHGNIAWGTDGWCWQDAAGGDFAEIWQLHRERWAARLSEVGEILRNFPTGLNAELLEGLLGIETGSLAFALDRWKSEGWLEESWEKGERRFLVRPADGGGSVLSGQSHDPLWSEQFLASLYDQGKYSAGVAWVDAMLADGRGAFAPRLALIAARHLVAEGFADRALAMLPSDTLAAAGERGLYFEIRARAEFTLGKWGEAKADLDRAEQEFAPDSSGIARVHNLRGTLAKAEAQFEQAEINYGRAVRSAKRAGDLYCAGIAETNLAICLQLQGKIDQAYQAYMNAWRFSREVTHPMLSQTLNHNWINLLMQMGRTAEAEKSCYDWLNGAIRERYREQEAWALNYLAILAGQNHLSERQAALLNQALGLLDPRKTPRLFAQLSANRALLCWSRENYAAAERDALTALKLCDRWRDDALLAWIYLVLGKVARDRPEADFEEAGEFLAKAEHNALKNNNHALLWEVQLEQGKLQRLRGDVDGARKSFEAARESLAELESHLPEAFRQSFLRDRKRDRIERELENLSGKSSGSKLDPTVTFDFITDR